MGWGWGDWCVSAGTAHNSNHSCSDPFETETEEGASSSSALLLPVPENEQVDESGKNSNAGHLPPKNSKFVKTHSLMLGVDRIDEYSQMIIQTPKESSLQRLTNCISAVVKAYMYFNSNHPVCRK